MAPAVDERNLRINGVNGSDSPIDSSGFGVGEIDRLQIRVVLLQFFQLYPAVGIVQRSICLNKQAYLQLRFRLVCTDIKMIL